MKYLITCLLLFFFTYNYTNLQAQIYQATYEADIKTNNGRMRSGNVALQFSDTASVFLHLDCPKENRFFLGEGNIMQAELGDPEELRIYTSTPRNVQLVTEEYDSPGDYNWVFVENIRRTPWRMESGTKEILGFVARKATGVFGGRQYEVWFAPEIPTPFGPHQLYGLPGLIVEAHSADGLVNYVLKGFESIEEHDINPPSKGQLTNLEQHEKRLINQLIRVERFNDETGSATFNSPSADHDIIKSRWTTIMQYKQKRGY